MKIGINTLLWTAGFDTTHLDLLPQFKQRGFDVVEIARFEFGSFPVAAVRKAVENTGLEPVFCSALTGQTSLVSDDPAVRNQAREFLLQGIETAAALGARVFVGPFCSPVGLLPGRRRTEDEWKRAVEGLQSLTDALSSHDVSIALEPLNRFETHFLNLTGDAVRLCEEVASDRIGILFDTFHANIEEKNIGAALTSCGAWLKHVHACENDRGIPGSGHVEWQDVFAALRRLQYGGRVVIESFGARIPEIATAACIWRDLAPSSESIAFEGLEFLRKNLPSSSTAAP
jgi:D-psicose/D-tagatose/L-ribulose 3-epimerase